MPIYEYECRACGYRFEKLQKVSDAQLKVCPTCNQPELGKLVSAAAFRLKGGGWYETDFKSGSKKNVLHGTDTSSDSSNAESSGGDKPASDKPASDKSGSDSKSGDSGNNSNSNASAAAS